MGKRFQKFTNIIKKKNFIIAFSVFVLTIVTINISYASFLTVKTNSNNQSVTTGTLNVTYASGSSSIIKDVVTAESNEEGLKQDTSSTIYIQNTGTLNSTFVLNIGYDIQNFMTNVVKTGNIEDFSLTPIDYIMVAVFEKGTNVTDENLIVGPISLAELPIYRLENNPLANRYSLMIGTIGNTENGDAARTYKIKTWLSSKAPQSVSYTYFYINSEIVSETVNAKMNYNLSGVIKDNANNPLPGAILSFHNGSLISETDSSGNYILNNIYPGVYNIDIKYNNKTYSGNLTVSEGNSESLSNLGSTFSGSNIYNAAAAYGTTIAKILNKNHINGYSNIVNISGGNLMPTYELVGASNRNINVNFIVDITNDSYIMSK